MAHRVNTSESLRRLTDADYEVAPGEYDVRSWRVMAVNDEPIGTVADLIIDPAVGKVRYLEVDVDRKVFQLERDRRVLIPIGSAQLEPKGKRVFLSGMSRAAASKLPDLVKEEIVISKEPVTTHQTVATDLRHEEVEVNRSSGKVRVEEEKKRRGDRRWRTSISSQNAEPMHDSGYSWRS